MACIIILSLDTKSEVGAAVIVAVKRVMVNLSGLRWIYGAQERTTK